MTPLHFGFDVELDDVRAVATAAFELGTALAKVPGVELTIVDTMDSVGARRDGVILAIAISFTTSLAASAAYDVLKEAVSHSSFQFSIKIEADFPSTSSGTSKRPHQSIQPNKGTAGGTAKQREGSSHRSRKPRSEDCR